MNLYQLLEEADLFFADHRFDKREPVYIVELPEAEYESIFKELEEKYKVPNYKGDKSKHFEINTEQGIIDVRKSAEKSTFPMPLGKNNELIN